MIALEHIEAARADALQARRRIVDVLEERLALDADDYVRRLGAAHSMPIVTMEELRGASGREATLEDIFLALTREGADGTAP